MIYDMKDNLGCKCQHCAIIVLKLKKYLFESGNFIIPRWIVILCMTFYGRSRMCLKYLVLEKAK